MDFFFPTVSSTKTYLEAKDTKESHIVGSLKDSGFKVLSWEGKGNRKCGRMVFDLIPETTEYIV